MSTIGYQIAEVNDKGDFFIIFGEYFLHPEYQFFHSLKKRPSSAEALEGSS